MLVSTELLLHEIGQADRENMNLNLMSLSRSNIGFTIL